MDKAIDEKEENCPICLSPLVDEPWARIYPCGHGAHTVCAAGWFVLHLQHLHDLADAYLSSRPINEQEKLCPLCRQQWEPQGAPVAVAPQPLGGTMEVTNHAMLVAYRASVAAAAAEVRAAAVPVALPDMDEEYQEGEEGWEGDQGYLGEEMPRGGDDSPAHRHPSRSDLYESTNKCSLCDHLLSGRMWTHAHPCGCCMHLDCFCAKLMDDDDPYYHPFHTLDLTRVQCPVCGRQPLHPPDLLGGYLAHYPVRPVAPLQYANPPLDHRDGVVSSWRVEHQCLWVAVVESMTTCRDRELQQLLSAEFLTPDDAHTRYRSQEKEMNELMEICYICRRPLACNYWINIGNCQHQFHLRCLCNHVVREGNEAGMVCPVCRIHLVYSNESIPLDFLWRPMDTLRYPGLTLFQLRELAFWWEVCRQRHILEGSAAMDP